MNARLNAAQDEPSASTICTGNPVFAGNIQSRLNSVADGSVKSCSLLYLPGAECISLSGLSRIEKYSHLRTHESPGRTSEQPFSKGLQRNSPLSKTEQRRSIEALHQLITILIDTFTISENNENDHSLPISI